MFEELLESWDGEEAVIRYDRESGAWMFVCVHSTALGPAGGGTRLRVYETPGHGLADAMRLSQAMTVKMAVADTDRGGGKAVLAVPARELVGDEIADVVAVARVLAPGVPEPDDEQVERRPLAAGPEPHGCA